MVLTCHIVVVILQKERKRTKETVVGGIIDAIDRGYELARIPKTAIKILTSFYVSTERSVNLIFRANLRHVTNKVKTIQRYGTRETPVPQETK